MQVVDDTSIFGQIREAIMAAEAAGNAIKQININQDEMEELLKVEIANEAADKHYASFLNEWAIHNIAPNKNIAGKSVPPSLWIKYVKIVTIPSLP